MKLKLGKLLKIDLNRLTTLITTTTEAFESRELPAALDRGDTIDIYAICSKSNVKWIETEALQYLQQQETLAKDHVMIDFSKGAVAEVYAPNLATALRNAFDEGRRYGNAEKLVTLAPPAALSNDVRRKLHAAYAALSEALKL